MIQKIAMGIALIGLVMTSVPAMAGGWAVVTLDTLPVKVVANQPLTIGFMVRQHGVTPMDGLKALLVFQREGEQNNKALVFDAMPAGSKGHYTATISLPAAGAWRWRIEAFNMLHNMPNLTAVSIAAQPTATSRRVALTEQIQQGEDLFLAKGCATCHIHAAVVSKVEMTIDIGPNLTYRKLDPDYVRIWLKDPSKVKPTTKMPNLNLGQTEIDALAAFLTQRP